MKKITLFAAAVALVLGASCAKDETSSSNNYTPVPVGESRYAVITKAVSSSTEDTSLVILTESDLTQGSTTIIGNGSDLGEKSPSEWTASSDGRYIYSVQDGGGGTLAQVVQYYLNRTTGLVVSNKEYEVSEYHTWGMWGDNYVTLRNSSSTSVSITDSEDGVAYYQPVIAGAMFSPIGVATYLNDTPSANYIGKNYTGGLNIDNGETALIVGHATAGNYVYVSFATSGVSRYEILDDQGRDDGWHSDGIADYYARYVAAGAGSYTCYYSKDVTTSSATTSAITSVTNSWNSRSLSKSVPFPLTPGNTYIARYSINDNLEDAPTIIATDKMAQAFGRQTGNPYNMVIPNEDDGYVYVFSPGTTRRYAATEAATLADNVVDEVTQYEFEHVGESGYEMSGDDATLSIATTNKGAKVMRIRIGRAEFDSSFGTEGVKDITTIEDASGDELVFSRVWHISGSKFLMRVIHTPGVFNVMHHSYRDPGDAYFYIYDALTNSATKVSGLPEPSLFVGQTRSSIGEPYIEGDMAYIPMAPSNKSYPLIYVVDSSSATATEGLEVKSSYIVSIAKLTAM